MWVYIYGYFSTTVGKTVDRGWVVVVSDFGENRFSLGGKISSQKGKPNVHVLFFFNFSLKFHLYKSRVNWEAKIKGV